MMLPRNPIRKENMIRLMVFKDPINVLTHTRLSISTRVQTAKNSMVNMDMDNQPENNVYTES